MARQNAAERGLSLVEVLVATAILSVAMVIALGLYDASRKAFAKGENATEQQESVRIAFDELTSDLRMLGYDVNPDGNPGRPDEQLEGALDHAIILRSDSDASDPTTSLTPEASLAGGAFSTVSTGNDEIVAYVLSKPDGTGPDAITFQADVKDAKRDGVVEPVTIPNVVLNPTNPPYTLYRVTLNNDASTYGSPAFIVRTPVAENVRDLSFVYHDVAGTFKDASPAISEALGARTTRGGLIRVEISLVGMTRQQDLSYSDATDPIAPTYRKFELKGDVTPRNLRLKGVLDLGADLTPPSKPATPTLAAGHCGGLIVSWASNPPVDGVTQYRINWGSSAVSVSGSRNVPGSPFFLDGLDHDVTYFVTIQARDAEGNTSARSDPSSATVTNLNTPSAPAVLTTSTDEMYHVTVSWTPVTTNTSNVPAADPIAPRIRDLAGYKLYWHPNASFTPSSLKAVVADETILSAGSAPPYYDTPVVACQDRYYVMTAVDTCGIESAPTAVSHGVAANTGILPKSPTNVQAHFLSAATARIRWNPITQDVSDNVIAIDRYQIYRSAPIDGAAPTSAAVWSPTPLAETTGISYIDNTVPPLPTGFVVYYRMTGTDSCNNVSAPSAEARLECTFTGDVEISDPTDGRKVSGMVTTTVTVTGGSDTYSGATITYVHKTAGLQRTFTSSSPGPTWTDTGWRALPIGEYTITATVTKVDGCPQSAVIQVTARSAPGPKP